MKDITRESRTSNSSTEKRDEVLLEHAPVVPHGSIAEEAPPTLTPEEEKRLYRKIDIRLMPMLTAMYLVSFLDRGV
jgi:hypothetical protein